MNITLKLLPPALLHMNSQLCEIHSGVVMGWNKLPDTAKKFIQGSTISFANPGGLAVTIYIDWKFIVDESLISILKLTRTSTFFC